MNKKTEGKLPKIYDDLESMLSDLMSYVENLENRKKEMEKYSKWYKVTSVFNKDYCDIVEDHKRNINILSTFCNYLYRHTDLFASIVGGTYLYEKYIKCPYSSR